MIRGVEKSTPLFILPRIPMSEFNIKEHFKWIPVLDKGHVELFDGMVTDPRLKIVNSARVSFAKESKELTERDIKLIDFLFKHEHFSTFRHSYFSFRIKAPLCVFRQWWKYQIASEWVENENVGAIQIPETNWNEASGRYIEFEPEFYIPTVMRGQSKDNKQGSAGVVDTVTKIVVNPEDFSEREVTTAAHTFLAWACNSSYQNYKDMVKAGVAKEQARMVLPQNIYSECIWTISLQGVLWFLHQRLKADAQWEIREYAKAVWQLLSPMLAPMLDEMVEDQ